MSTTNENVSNKLNSKIVNVNIDSITKRLLNIVGTSQKTKDSIYVYPNDFTAIDISGKKGKSFRVKRRNQFEQIVNAYSHILKQKEMKTISLQIFSESAKEIVNVFQDIYKQFYRINDYSFASVSQSNNEGKAIEIKSFLLFTKDFLSTNKTEKKEKKAIVTPAKKSVKKAVITPAIVEIKA